MSYCGWKMRKAFEHEGLLPFLAEELLESYIQVMRKLGADDREIFFNTEAMIQEAEHQYAMVM